MKTFFAKYARCAALALLAVSLIFIFSCGSDNPVSTQTEASSVTEAALQDKTVTEVVITVNKEKIPSNGSEAVYITANAINAEGETVPDAVITYFAQGDALNSPIFYSTTPGFYNLYAYCNDIRSNVIEVQVVDSDVAKVSLYAGSTTIAAGQRLNTVINAYKSNGNRASRKGVLYCDGVELSERSFTSDDPGLHILYAEVLDVRSQPIAVMISDGTPPDATLALGAASSSMNLGETAAFTATLADSDGNQITGKISDCELYLIENDYVTLTKIDGGKYTPTAAGKFYFVAVCKGVASRVFALSVTDPNAPKYLGADSDIAVIVIDTHGADLSETYTNVTMYVYDSGSTNSRTDKPTIVTEAQIRWRGQSSLGFPKKQFALHTVTYNGANNNISLLGMPEENDWVLNGSYADKSLIRNGFAYTLFGLTCTYAPRYKYCEVYINNSDNPDNPLNYQGVYACIEKIKVDQNRVNIDKMTAEDNSGDALTGGYIVAIDKYKDGDYHFDTDFGTFVLSYPDEDEITTAQRNYITNYIMDFTEALHSDHFTDPETGYRKYLDVDSTVRHLAVTELLRNVDGFIISTYFYKPRNGLLYAGPAWDYDLTLGNADYADGANPEGWYVTSMPLSRHLLRDPYFHQYYIDVWKQLRQNILGDDNLVQYMDDQVSMIGNALQRSLARWPEQWDGFTYIWPNLMGDDYRATHEQEIAAMKKFILTRAHWIDEQIENASW
jgi:Spore coat assembly protein